MVLFHRFFTGVMLMVNRGIMLMLAIIGICGITGVNISITSIKGVAVQPKT
jgi:hypothetical protein